MFKFNRLVCVLLVCAVVAVAYGKAIKIKAISPVGLGVIENPDADGMAVLNYHQGNNSTESTVAITDFLPDTEYGITVVALGGGATTVTTNAAGNANWHAVFDRDICEFETEICVVVWLDDDEPADGRDPDGSEDRAEGCAPCAE